MRTILILAAAVSFAALAPSAFAARPVDLSSWYAQPGDHAVFDVESNWGYLLHENSSEYLSFPIASGQQRVIRYIGRVYDATTPVTEWVAKARKIQSDRITFGPTGRFLRLFKNGETSTAYGIHSYAYVTQWLASEDRFKSAGCIVVSEEIYDIIERTFDVNDERLPVSTIHGMQRLLQELSFRERRELERGLSGAHHRRSYTGGARRGA